MKTITMLKSSAILIVLGLLLSLPMSINAQTIIEIQVSPSTLNLQNQGQVVTVHTDIAYSTVDTETVFMNGIEISSWKADNQGNFVAKFLMDEIVDLPLDIGDYNTLTLEGITFNGESFTGSDEVMVIDVSAKGKR